MDEGGREGGREGRERGREGDRRGREIGEGEREGGTNAKTRDLSVTQALHYVQYVCVYIRMYSTCTYVCIFTKGTCHQPSQVAGWAKICVCTHVRF